ncbi:competence type IV pilus minor pilin ComGF [Streptococcus pluranimalium]|uniref:competence type IV pilus minor pilin ComGF n=1 Tax=Streptococcus pluranimalium TaxID=82348 RepID=UPI0039FC2542
MERKCCVLRSYRLRAFTLIECLLALLVLSGAIQVYQAMTHLVSAHTHQLAQPRDRDWLLFCQQFRAELSEASLVKVSERQLVIQKDNKELAFGKSRKDDFRKTAADGRGYQPMLYGLKSAYFSQNEETVTVTVVFKDGKVRDFLYAFDKES